MEVRLTERIRQSPERMTTEVLHSCQDMRVLLIHLAPGESLPPQASSSSVSIQIVEGRGEILSGEEWVPVAAGVIRFFPPQEPHGVRAVEEPVTVMATLAPRP